MQRPSSKSVPNTVHEAAEHGDLAILDLYIKRGLEKGHAESVTLQEREPVVGMMPLHVACEYGKFEVVQYLIKKRVDLDAGDNFRVTPLHLAAISNHLNVVKLLLDHGAPVEPLNTDGDSPLHWAAIKGNTEVMKYLISRKATANLGNKLGWTAMHHAAYNGRTTAVAELLKAGGNTAIVNLEGNNALHLAVMMNHMSTAEVLLQYNARADLPNNQKKLPEDLALCEAMTQLLSKYKSGSSKPPAAPVHPLMKETAPEAGKPMAGPVASLAGANLLKSESFVGRAKAKNEELFPSSFPDGTGARGARRSSKAS